MRKRDEMVKDYAGILTAIVVFVVYAALMLRFTDEDMLEIIVSYLTFLLAPAYMIPFFIGGEDEDSE